ncbi:MAG: hypothetical protein J7J70_05120 [Deltaproteobacteria bacterium]|nr:hypothetical protein [Candidatus Tharpellaceae bacterium]
MIWNYSKALNEIGRADELGSGVRNLLKYSALYGGTKPELIEDDIFRVVVPLGKQAAEQVTEQVGKLLAFCSEPKSRKEMQEFLGLKHREHFRSDILQPLLDQGLLKQTIPDSPTSPKQKYYAVQQK